MTVKQILPIGIDDFRKVRENGYYYVDKTLMIQDFIENKDEVALVTRPSRFGKTLNMTMLREFFDLAKESRIIFEGLSIMNTPCQDQINTVPVVYFTMKNCSGSTSEELLYKLCDTLFLEYGRYEKLFEGKINKDDYRYLSFYQNLELFKQGTHTFITISLAITHLMRAIHAFYGKKVVLLIDEYDQPILSSYENGYKKEAGEFFADFYSSALKGNPDLSQALLTGIQRVAKESIFSKLNNVQVYTVLDPFYASYFGLTGLETERLLDDYGYELNDEIRMMYDGYRFGMTEMYNPWSLLCYVKNGILNNYWINTSTNFLIKEALKSPGQGFQSKFDLLMLQGTADIEANLETSFIELQDGRSLWGLLINSGYLTVEAVLNPRQTRLRVRIPNGEVRENEIFLRAGRPCAVCGNRAQ